MRKAIPWLVSAGLIGVVAFAIHDNTQKTQAAYDRGQAAFGPHNPDDFQYPVCVSQDNDWGVAMTRNGQWYVDDPKRGLIKIHGHWSSYPQLTNLSCREQS